MSQSEPEGGPFDICPHCKTGAPIRWRDDTKEFIHEHIRTTDAFRTTSFSQVYCIATPLRIAANG